MSAAVSTMPPCAAASSGRQRYLQLLGWAFALFNSMRVLTYLPTMWAIESSGQSGQHSLVTWLTWTGANATMAAWLYENAGQRANRAAMVSVGNAVMCAATSALIVWHRL